MAEEDNNGLFSGGGNFYHPTSSKYSAVNNLDSDDEAAGRVYYPSETRNSCGWKYSFFILLILFITNELSKQYTSAPTLIQNLEILKDKIAGHQVQSPISSPIPCETSSSELNVVSKLPFQKNAWSKLDKSKLVYKSQYGEDNYVISHFFKRGDSYLTNGVYFEIGAVDGVLKSNSYIFEHAFNWSGYLVEAQPKNYQQLLKKRDSKNNLMVGKAVCENGTEEVHFTDQEGSLMGMITDKEDERHKIVVQCTTLAEIFAEKPTSRVDFLSLDVEGVELEFLKQWPWSEIQLGVLMIEWRPEPKDYRYDLYNLLTKHGLEFYGDHRPPYDGQAYKAPRIYNFTRNVVYVHPSYLRDLRKFLES